MLRDGEKRVLQGRMIISGDRTGMAQHAGVQDCDPITYGGDFGQHVRGQDHRGTGGGLGADQCP